jgi:hypothetical protein
MNNVDAPIYSSREPDVPALKGLCWIKLAAEEPRVSVDPAAIVPLGYRARCAEPACRNLGRPILCYADAGGRPMSNAEFCHAHARMRTEGAHAARLKVYDDREVGASTGG